ncbi:MAG: hypothetical protein CSA33_04315 [Desulfobulbus propionicus]|nr:MAG: hypothetical protein CSA33_04315 [Desulfobulbus propionicus]
MGNPDQVYCSSLLLYCKGASDAGGKEAGITGKKRPWRQTGKERHSQQAPLPEEKEKERARRGKKLTVELKRCTSPRMTRP